MSRRRRPTCLLKYRTQLGQKFRRWAKPGVEDISDDDLILASEVFKLIAETLPKLPAMISLRRHE